MATSVNPIPMRLVDVTGADLFTGSGPSVVSVEPLPHVPVDSAGRVVTLGGISQPLARYDASNAVVISLTDYIVYCGYDFISLLIMSVTLPPSAPAGFTVWLMFGYNSATDVQILDPSTSFLSEYVHADQMGDSVTPNYPSWLIFSFIGGTWHLVGSQNFEGT